MTKFFLSSVLLLTAISACAQTALKDKVAFDFQKETPYDTISLKGNYRLIFTTGNNLRVVWLWGPSDPKVITSNSTELNIKQSPYFEADFSKYFILATKDGNDIKHIALYSKENGEELEGGVGLKNDTLNNIVYFVREEEIGALPLNTLKAEFFPAPSDTGCLQWWNCINGVFLLEKEFVINYTSSNGNKAKEKRYRR